MRRETRFCGVAASIAFYAIALGPATRVAGAESDADRDELDRWLPSLALSFDVHHQSFDVSATSDLGYSANDTTNVLTSVFAVDGAISTPALAEGFGAPRLFVQAGVQIPISDEQTILRVAESFPPPNSMGVLDPLTIANCPDLGGVPTKTSCDQSLSSTLTFNVNWSAGLGAEFTLPTPSRSFKIRTAIEYFGQSLDFDGDAKRDDRTSTATMKGSIVDTLTIAGASASETFHAIGPRLSFAGEVGRVGPLSFAVFAETRLYWLLNADDIQFGVTTADGSSSFVVDPDPLVAQGGAGLRITWVGSP
jgi:hypothetical protein